VKNLDRASTLAALLTSEHCTDVSYANCALRRIARTLGLTGDNYDVGRAIGLSAGETLGVMRGWDRACGLKPVLDKCFTRDVRGLEVLDEDVQAGEALGEYLHARVGA
jgi:hypothetical protein